ncbi:MAG: hypothetical protein VX906_00525 [Candidatus Thermoplasmatota archaeon]|nr:hypothetical protein [Candidatus Thermoplasmatota archaeon]
MFGANISHLGSRITWFVIFIWFGANLLSQALYLGLNGEPYNANEMLASIGYWYWIFVVLELLIWLLLGSVLLRKFRLKSISNPITERV